MTKYTYMLRRDAASVNDSGKKRLAGSITSSPLLKIPEVTLAHSHGKLTTNPWNDSNPYTGMRSSASG